MSVRALTAGIGIVLLAGCTTESIGPLGSGTWGGVGASMSLTTGGVIFEFDCAHGRLNGPLAIRGDRFSEPGVYVREHGGPSEPGGEADEVPARYDGEVRGRTLSLTILPADVTEPIGPYILGRGDPPELRKCL